MDTLILKLDIAGNPVRWIDWQTAVTLYARDDVAWDLGDDAIVVHGGWSRLLDAQTQVAIRPIISVRGKVSESSYCNQVPPLSNRTLFHRDQKTCMYCGQQLDASILTRDHVIPKVQGGRDIWANVVTACKPCNQRKGGRQPDQAGMPLLAIPYVPNRAEWLILSNRGIGADQMSFLRHRVGKNSRLFQ